MAARGNRTVLCSVVFIDIVEYSKKSVEEQMQIKQQFNELLLRVLDNVPADDRIILDTGDGAAINFLGDPEECLFVALALRDALALRTDQALQLRIGVNLGPVRLVKDINGQPNIIGDGINVAQRIMSFADVNQVLVSRSFYELISALSADYAQQFAFEGARTDKHVREHEVYALGRAPAPQRIGRKAAEPQPARTNPQRRRIEFAAASAHAYVMRRPPIATAMAVGLILVVAVGLRLTLRGAEGSSRVEYAARPAAEVAAPPAIEPAARVPAPQVTLPQSRSPEPERKAFAERAPDPVPVARPKPATEPQPEARPREQPVPTATGTVRLNVQPWGEVYVDGRKLGVTPPLQNLALNAGTHRIEIRNPGFQSHVQVVEVKAREEIRIRHRFQ